MSTPTLPLTGKTALITGASRGIGAAVALLLSSQGAHVVINYSSSDPSTADALVSRIGADKAVAIRADASRVPEIERLVQETVAWEGSGGKIDIVIANAALGLLTCTLENTSEDEFDRSMALNVKGSYFLVQVSEIGFFFWFFFTQGT